MTNKDGVMITPGMRKAFLEAESVEKAKELAKKVGIEMTDEEAEKFFNMVGKEDLSDDELDSAAGGCECNYCSGVYECGDACMWFCPESMR